MEWNSAMDDYLIQNFGRVTLKTLKENIGEGLNIFKRARKLNIETIGSDKFSLDDLKDLSELLASSTPIIEIMEFFKTKKKSAIYSQIEGLKNMSKYESNPVEELKTNKDYSDQELAYIKDCITNKIPTSQMNLPGRSPQALKQKVTMIRKQLKEGEKIATDILKSRELPKKRKYTKRVKTDKPFLELIQPSQEPEKPATEDEYTTITKLILGRLESLKLYSKFVNHQKLSYTTTEFDIELKITRKEINES
jgi:hypothetical protein